ncbi:hypothetical protein FFLO_07034 [Filobasidium floriforme]|uniref:EamA domain-containing protein n=1 Tax=Filobasidium floriforme TaxID=5210 RepID=A0A8K0NK15_9TREE|nr:uncharacterized protein HD553DRAFT_319917 [Filobasidium floriforme]KAG7527333.1 hypothetical protein FFLO_07034 [Filobasidium floriforme]KAH8078352.1 hypothetical protein HD553DRAFT_319917 [Filobasidium floriforme]
MSKMVSDETLGVILVSLSTCTASIANMCIKRLAGLVVPIHTLQMIRFRMLPTWIVCLSYLYITGRPSPFLGPKGIRGLLIGRGSLSFVSMLGTYTALKGLTLAEATLIGFLNPVITGILGAVCLGEKYTLRQAIATLLSLAGILISLQTPLQTLGKAPRLSADLGAGGGMGKGVALIIGVGSVTAGALSSILIRKMGKNGDVVRQITAYAMVSTLGSTACIRYMPGIPELPRYGTWTIYAIVATVFGSLGQVLMTSGMKRGKAGTSALGNYTAIIYATLLEYAVDGKVPGMRQVVGCGLIVGASLYGRR